jgi:4a-hydroxytetrahydrobiopterin dehydratase
LERQVVQSPDAARDGKRKLGAGSEAGMGGNVLQYIDGMRTIERKRSFHLLQIFLDTLAFRTGNARMLCAPDAKAGPKVTDGKSNAAELAAQSAVEIKKTEMQPGGNGDGNLGRSCNVIAQAQSPESRPSAGFFSGNSGLKCGVPSRLATRAKKPSKDSAMSEAKKERTYTDEEIEQRLKRDLPHWYLENGWIRRKYRTNSWKSTLMVINTVGHLAEAAWHHPDITASYAWVEVRLQNHAAKGITDKDFELAKKIEDVVHWQPAKSGGALEGTPEKDQRFAYIKYDE